MVEGGEEGEHPDCGGAIKHDFVCAIRAYVQCVSSVSLRHNSKRKGHEYIGTPSFVPGCVIRQYRDWLRAGCFCEDGEIVGFGG